MSEQSTINASLAPSLEGTGAATIRNSPGEISLLEILTALARRKWLIGIVTGSAMLIGVALAFLLPVRYTATTRIMPPQQTPSTALMMNQLAASGSGSLAALASGGLGLKNPNDIYIGLLESRPVADSIIHDFGLQKAYRSKNLSSARRTLAGRTTIASEKSNLLSISVTDRDKNRAAAIANAYTDQLRVLTQNLAVSEASQRRLFYEGQMKQAKDALVSADLAFQQVQQQKGLVSLDAQSKTILEGLAGLRAEAAAKQVQVQALRSYSTERNPDLQLAERELGTLQAESAQLTQRSHSREFANLGLADVPSAGLDYLRAQHELLYRQTLFDLLIKQYDVARLDEAKEAAIIQVVEPAIPPDRKSAPKRALILVVCTVMGFFFGCLLSLLAWWKENLMAEPVLAGQLRELKRALLEPNPKTS
jgi:tyrosine-protein kinase Etk/Wzc